MPGGGGEGHMGFGQAIEACFRKYASLAGRASRSEYWFFVLFGVLVGFAATAFDSLASGAVSTARPASGFSALALFLPGLAVTVRRLHDLDRSGTWAIPLALVGLYNLALTLSVFPQASLAHIGHTASIGIGVLGVALLIYDLILLVIMAFRGTNGPNRYGPDPLAADT